MYICIHWEFRNKPKWINLTIHILHVFYLQGADHREGIVAMRKVIKECKLKAPELLTSTNLRKYMATVSQVCTAQQTEIFNTRITMGGVIYQ